MKFAILGPLEIRRDDGAEIALAGARRRTLLQRLLVDSNHPVPASVLCEDVWEGAPPGGAAQTLQSHVSHLRKVLGHDRLRTVGPSYVITIKPGELDSRAFEDELTIARQLLDSGEVARVPEQLATALRLWRGGALSEVANESWARAEAARLEELRIRANELLLDAWLQVGDHERVVSESARLIADHPFHERFWAQAMLALYRSGRQTDALRTYTRLRDTLVTELGIEPSSDVARLERAILDHDDASLLEPVETRATRPTGLPTGVVTFVLTDVVSSTRLSDQASASMAEALQLHDDIVRDVMRAAGGVLLKGRGEGDSTFTVFQRASDAVGATATLRERLERTTWPAGATVSIRIAVYTGEAVERDGDYFGATVNRAARLRSAASMGDTLLSASTAELVIDRLPPDTRLVELGPVPLGDLARPEIAYALRVGAHDVGLDPQPVETFAVPLPESVAAYADQSRHAPFVGRRRELSRLEGLFEEATNGRPGVIVVSGEPGIGKTRLVSTAAEAARTRGATVLYGRCDQRLGVAYQPWIEALSPLVAHAPDALLADYVARHGAHLERLVPELSQRVQPLRQSADSPLDERYLLFRAVAELLRLFASWSPVVVVLDDLHEADEPSLALFGHLVDHDRPASTMLLATQRPVAIEHPLAELLASRRDLDVARIELAGLEPSEVLQLVEALAGHEVDAESARLRDELHAETAGNPFFVVELVRHLAETGAVKPDANGHWVAGRELLDHGLPTSIRDVVARRIARLGADTESILAIGAVAGRAFDVDVVSSVAGRSEQSVLDACDAAVAAGLLQEDIDPNRYAFAHALVARALRERLSVPRRAHLHRTIAAAIERTAGSLDDRAGELALHWSSTGRNDTDKVVHYAQRAGDRALHQLAPDAAARWYALGLDALETQAPDDARRPALLCGLGEAQRDLGEPEHRETLLGAARTAGALGQSEVLIRAALANQRGWTSIIGAVDLDRLAALQQALAAAPSESPAHARLLATLCAEQHYGLPLDARVSLAAEAVRIARLAGEPTTLAFALSMPYLSITMPQTLALRTRWSDEACRLADGAGDPALRFWTHTYRALAGLGAGDLDAMRDHGSVAAEEARRIGSPLLTWEDMQHRAASEILAGDLAAAERTAAAAFELGTSLGQADAFVIFGGQLHVIRWMQGRLDEILPIIEDGTAANPGIEVFRAGLSFVLARLGRLDEATVAMAPFADRDFELFADANWLMSNVLVADAAARIGSAPAIDRYRNRLAPFRDQFVISHSTVVGAVAHYLGLLAAAAGDQRAARDYLEQALSMHERLEAPYFVTETEAVLGAVLGRSRSDTDRERGRSLLQTAQDRAAACGYRDVAADARAIVTPR